MKMVFFIGLCIFVVQFKQTIKAQLASLFECCGGDADVRSRYWRHFDFLNEKGNQKHIESVRDPTGDRHRKKYLTEQVI